MNARLIKETRVLLPTLGCMLMLIVVPYLLCRAAEFGYIVLGLACVVMAGSSFGSEFQHRTVSLLLSQPIARSVIWRDKMLVLGASLVTSMVVLVVCLTASGSLNEPLAWLPLIFIPLCAFCGAPCWTIMLRHEIGGMVAAAGFPAALMAVCALVYEWLGAINEGALVTTMLSLLLIYCALAYGLGYAKFKRLEAVDTPSRELSLPAGLEAFLVRPLTRVSSRYRGQFAALLKKEFRLQQISFLLAGVFVVIAVAGFCVAMRRPDISAGIVGGDLFIYVLILPLIAGAISVGEERGWGMAEWHLTLPPSALRQWSAKMVATISISLVLGLLLPTVIFVAAHPLFSEPGTGPTVPPAFAILCWILGQLLLTSVAVYAASFSRTTMQAMLTTFVILAALAGTLGLAATWVREVAHAPIPWLGVRNMGELLVMPLLTAALVFALCLFQWLAWSNFRRYALPAVRLSLQFTLVLLSVWLVAWFFFSALFPPTWS